MEDHTEKSDKIFKLNPENFLSNHSVDCVILGYQDAQLKILLLQWIYEDFWMLPGGFIFKDEDMDDAAQRVLKERTGLGSIFLKQFYTFGKGNRPNLMSLKASEKSKLWFDELKESYPVQYKWMDNRFITTGYFALADIDKVFPKPDAMSVKCEWKAVNDLPRLVLDHEMVIQKGLEHLQMLLNYLPISISLLPKEFTMQDLQKLYETILKKTFERSNFQKRMLKLGVFIRLEKKMTGARNKAPYLYCFDKEKYEDLVNRGIGIAL